MARKGTTKSTFLSRRKGFLARWMPLVRRVGLVGGVLVFALWIGAWLVMSGTVGRAAEWSTHTALDLSADAGFAVKDVLVEGRVNTDPDVLKALINIQKGDPLFSFDPAEARELIERISWVREARVQRLLPGTVYIGLTERRPLALWQKKKRLILIDEGGEIITDSGLENFRDLIIVTGDNAPEHTPHLLAMLSAEPDLLERVEAAARVSDRRWDLKLKSGIRVRLPEDDIGFALRRLAMTQEEERILDKDIVNVDLREPDRIVVRTRPGAVQTYKAGLKGGDPI